MKKHLGNYCNQEFTKEKHLFKNEGVFSIKFIPLELPGRDGVIRKLAYFFRGLVNQTNATPRFITLWGNAGTGKTTVALCFGKNIEKIAHKYKRRVIFRLVNCRKIHTPYLILVWLIESLIPYFPGRGFSICELFSVVIDVLDTEDLFLLLVLDEIDLIPNSKALENFFSLLRCQTNDLSSSNIVSSKISTILISRNGSSQNYIDERALGIIGMSKIQVLPYTTSELHEILSKRVELALKSGVVPDHIISSLIQMQYVQGNARRAIDVLWNAVKIAEESNERNIKTEHLDAAITSFPPPVEYIENLSIHHRILLSSIIALSNSSPGSSNRINFKSICSQYRLICDDCFIKPKKRTQIWNYTQILLLHGLIKKIKNNQKAVLYNLNYDFESVRLLKNELK